MKTDSSLKEYKSLRAGTVKDTFVHCLPFTYHVSKSECGEAIKNSDTETILCLYGGLSFTPSACLFKQLLLLSRSQCYDLDQLAQKTHKIRICCMDCIFDCASISWYHTVLVCDYKRVQGITVMQ